MTPIGIFDSGYGGLTILQAIRQLLPQYDYIYLGDNARAPYGTRSFDIIYQYTLQAVNKLFSLNCPLIILACNTASAKALRNIQQRDLPRLDKIYKTPPTQETGQAAVPTLPDSEQECEPTIPPTAQQLFTLHSSLFTPPARRVLGIIRPTVEALPNITHNQHIGILATPGTIQSNSYPLEIRKFLPNAVITGVACPMWVPIVENNYHQSPGADYFIQQPIEQLLQTDPLIDAILLACTHYPLLLPKIRQHTPAHIQIIPQGNYIAASLKNYLHRHPEINAQLTQSHTTTYLTTEHPHTFQQAAQLFLQQSSIQAQHITLA